MRIDSRWYTRPDGIAEHVAVGGVVVREDGGRIFVALVLEGDDEAYVLPKGHVETGESLEAAARREIGEEAGVTELLPLGALGVRERLNYRRTSWKRTHYFLFLTERTSTPSSGRQRRVLWAPIDALPAMFWPEQQDLIEANRPAIVELVTIATDRRKRAVQTQFGRRAGAYARSDSHRRDVDLDLLISHLQATTRDRALDVATGTGFTAFALRPHVRSVIGVDLTRGMLEEARRLTPVGDGLAWVVGDAEALPFVDGIFQIVTCRRAPHHFPHIERAVSEMVRMLAPGGRLGIVDQVPPEDTPGHNLMETIEVLRDPSHVQALRASRWQSLLMDCGVVPAFMQLVERRQTIKAWLELAGADDAAARAIAAMVRGGAPQALEQIGYQETPEPAFLKRWLVLVGRK